KNPLDFLLSGIPMSPGSSGTKEQFVSAGMFDLSASANGKKVFLKKGCKVDVTLSSVDKNQDYNLYSFNDAAGRWEMKADKNKVKVVASSSAPGESPYFYSSAVYSYMDFLSRGTNYIYDSTTCKKRFESLNYYYTKKNDKKEIGENRWWWCGKPFRELIKVANVHKSKNGTITFQIVRAIGTNRELMPYQSVVWRLEDKMKFQDFKLLVDFKNYFFDIRIEQSGEEYVLRLKGMNGFKEIKAVPVKLNKNHAIAEYSEKVKNKLYTRYYKLLRWREKFFDHQLVQGKIDCNYFLAPAEDRPMYAWRAAKQKMTTEEKQMSFGDWKTYVEAKREDEMASINASAATSSSITRSFSIDGMGIWNCDQIRRLKNPVQIMAEYTNERGEPVSATATFIVDKNLNGLLQYYNGPVAFSKTAETVLIAILPKGEIGVVMPDYFKGKSFYDNKTYTFPLKELSAGTASVQELKKLIGL
ncbi:MAG TPA: hypothetical protein VII99_01765, partial [Bacteroidia bacterium]